MIKRILFALVLLAGIVPVLLTNTHRITVADGSDPMPVCRKNVCPPLQ